MKRSLTLTALIFLMFAYDARSQDTFSIVAIDPLTGEVGSAGASCIAGSIILSDVHPGRGVIHSQASYLSANQNYARSLMNLGLSPEQIRDSMIAHDSQNNPSVRQYGIVDLIGGGRTAAYTGVNCFNYKNHILGTTYSIQGNILLGQQILDSMQSRFLRTTGTLADKMMAALQGAKVIGADTRCTGRNTSSISAFIRMGRPQDTSGILFLDLNVNNTPVGRDPIDSLQILYNNFLTSVKNVSNEIPVSIELFQNYPNPFNPITNIKFSIPEKKSADLSKVKLVIYDLLGSEVTTLVNDDLGPGTYEVTWYAEGMPSGVYYYKLYREENTITKRMALIK
ncbi:MAG: DUF1028 domain-containing protein [Ignavibacteria bacterium]